MATASTDIKKTFADIKAEIKKLKEQAASHAVEAFNVGLRDVFAAHPKLESFRWTQYTPYFNDGDECTFSAHRDYLKMNFGGEEFEEVSDWAFSDKASQYNERERAAVGLKEAWEAASTFLGAFEDEDLRDIFGDHVEVVASAPGKAEAEGYSHD